MTEKFCIRCGHELVAATDPDRKPVCPECGWFLATSALPVALVLAHTATGEIVYTRQSGWPEGAWGLVAGYVEPGETAEMAGLRELHEETGLEGRAPRVLRTVSFGGLVCIVVDVEIEGGVPGAASDVEAVLLRKPDLALTPGSWPAHAVIAEFIARSRRLDGRQLQLWSRIASRAEELRALLAEMDENAWETRCAAESWPVGLVGCHVSLGLRRQAKWVERALAGRPPHVFDWERTHALNALVERRAVRIAPRDVVDAISGAVERWRDLLMRVRDADLARPAFRYQDREQTIEWVAGALVPRHIDDHLRSIRSAVTGASSA